MKGDWTLKYTNWKVREFKRENEGFIYPAKGQKALYLSLAIYKNIKFRTSSFTSNIEFLKNDKNT